MSFTFETINKLMKFIAQNTEVKQKNTTELPLCSNAFNST